MYNILLRLRPEKVCAIYCDAQYVLNGLTARSKHYRAGSKGDIWVRIYALPDRRTDGDISFLKVKSHVETPEDFIKHNLIEEGLILDELAGAAATAATTHFGRLPIAVQADKVELKKTYLVARRRATIEAYIWRNQPARPPLDPNHEKLRASQTQAVRRKLGQAKLNTTGDRGHRTYRSGKWLKCFDCLNVPHASNQKYWVDRPCIKRYCKPRTTALGRETEQYRQYVLHHPTEHFRMDDAATSTQHLHMKLNFLGHPPRSLHTFSARIVRSPVRTPRSPGVTIASWRHASHARSSRDMHLMRGLLHLCLL